MTSVSDRQTRTSRHTGTSCLLCASKQFTSDERFPPGEWGLRSCRICGLVETCPFPTKEQRLAENRAKYGGAFLAMQQGHEAGNHRIHRRALAEITKAAKSPGRRLLDVGCGAGQFLRAAIQAGWDAEGLELNWANATAVSESGMRVFTGTIEEAAYPSRTFDVVTLWDVLEHVDDPMTFLKETLRVLKPDGLVFLQSPNIHSDVAACWGIRWPWLCLPDHLYHFNPDTIRLLFEKAGFVVHNVYTWEPMISRVKSIANRRAGASTGEKLVRILLGLAPAAICRLAGANSRRMGLLRAIAYKRGR